MDDSRRFIARYRWRSIGSAKAIEIEDIEARVTELAHEAVSQGRNAL
jgi:hypothetical protein